LDNFGSDQFERLCNIKDSPHDLLGLAPILVHVDDFLSAEDKSLGVIVKKTTELGAIDLARLGLIIRILLQLTFPP
jgi:hypothetical protein